MSDDEQKWRTCVITDLTMLNDQITKLRRQTAILPFFLLVMLAEYALFRMMK